MCRGMPTVPDPTTAVEVYSAQKLLFRLAHRVLGDTADYLGAGLKYWTERRAENVRRILKRADERLTDEGREKGAVPPRVVKGVLEDGSFADDPLVQNYFGGVLAASRSENARDDRGAVLTALVGRLSTYAVQTHYLIYAHAQRRLSHHPWFNLGLDNERRAHGRIHLPFELWIDGMGLSAEFAVENDVIYDVIHELLREDLVERPFGFGDVTRVGFPRSFRGVAVQLTPLGVQLFMWAHGVNRGALHWFLDPELELSMPDVPPLQEGALALADLTPPAVSRRGARSRR